MLREASALEISGAATSGIAWRWWITNDARPGAATSVLPASAEDATTQLSERDCAVARSENASSSVGALTLVIWLGCEGRTLRSASGGASRSTAPECRTS
eukprot:scaffold294182_cov33-Tisochrysis_lutea.AAC.2